MKIVSQRKSWKRLGNKEYICPVCKRDKGMLYLFADGTIRYVCFCGRNISVSWIKEKYNFDNKEFSKDSRNNQQTRK